MRRREFIASFGAAAAWPFDALEYPALPTIVFLHPGAAERYGELVAAFHQGLAETGYVSGRNVAIEYYWAENRYGRLPELAAGAVRSGAAVIVTTSTAAVLFVRDAARDAGSNVPIVFNFSSDPVELGLVASLGRPGGRITGATFLSAELAPKQFELLQTAVPSAATLALLVDNTHPRFSEQISNVVRTAAEARGFALEILQACDEGGLDAAFAGLDRLRADALLIAPNTYLGTRYERLAALTVRRALPAIYQFRGFAVSGGLMSYGTIHADSYREAGVYAGRILAGVDPASLPVKQPTRFELVINMRTARAFGLDLPRALLVRADEVIE